MAEHSETLPVLPLTSGVMLPGMVTTIALESDEAKVAAEAAGSAGGRVLLVPHIEGRYGRVGVVGEILEAGQLPGGPARCPGRARYQAGPPGGNRSSCRPLAFSSVPSP